VNAKNFFTELRRRNVYKVAIAYAVVAWLLMQVASQIFPFFEIPNWAVRLVVLLLIIGFPVALILAWAFELTPEGIKRTEFADELPSKAPRHRAWIYVVIIGGAISVGVFFLGRYTSSKQSAELPAKSIAVLPFDNQGRDSGTDYLSDGIPESIINSLSQLSQLKVMARSTVFQYKGKEVDPRKVGHDLGVRAVLMGRLIQQGDNLTVRTELANVLDGTELWGQQYNRKLADVFAVQEEIAKEISEKLRLKLTGAERQQLAKRPTENLKAFQYYMQGRSVSQTNTREVNYDWNWSAAEKEFKRSIELKPDYATAHEWYAIHYLTATGRLEEAVQEMKKALELEPASLVMNTFMGATLYYAGRYDEAIDQCRRTIEMDPNFTVAHWYLGLAYEQKQVLDAATEEFKKAISLSGGSPLMKAALGRAYAKSQKKHEANEMLNELNELSKQHYVSAYEVATIYVALGNNQQAFQLLEEAYAEHSFHLVYLNVSPQFKPVSSDRRFQNLVQRIGLSR
jgi:TolB-like protein/Flp pilus assembly protein TadD